MSDIKTPTRDPNLVPVAHLYFADAMDLLEEHQISNIKCSPTVPEQGRGYVCRYVKDMSSFEVGCYNGGTVNATYMIPREQIKRFVVAK